MQNKNNDKILAAVIAYFWLPGWIIGLLLYRGSFNFFNKFHLRQSFVLHLLSVILLIADIVIKKYIPLLYPFMWIINLILFAMYIDGLIMAFCKKIDFVFGTKQIFKLIFHETLNY